MLRTGFSILALLACLAVHPFAQTQTQMPTRTASKPSAARAGKPAVTVNIKPPAPWRLEQLPGIGAKTAERIVDYRQKKGPFKKIEDFRGARAFTGLSNGWDSAEELVDQTERLSKGAARPVLRALGYRAWSRRSAAGE